MKFTDGFWQVRPGVHPLYAEEAYDIAAEHDESGGGRLVVTAPTRVISSRGDTLNRPTLTVTLSSPLAGVIAVRVEHFAGGHQKPGFGLPGAQAGQGEARADTTGGTLTSGDLEAVVRPGSPWHLEFRQGGRLLTGLGPRSLGHITLDDTAAVDHGVVGAPGRPADPPETFLLAQLDLAVGELVHGLGERFGPVVKNGQRVDVWNADGGTSSEQAYKNVPFYLTNRGYGVLVDHPGHVSFEVGSEAVERVQFSVPGEAMTFYVIAGDGPKGVLERYTALTGRPGAVPAWSYGLWLSTSFTTSYDEETVTSFIEGMAQRDLPLSVFHFDCFWMREFNWCDFEWDARVFPDPVGMLERLHARDLRVCVWINPYLGQRSPLFAEAQEAGYLLRRPDGSVWQWDMWQAGMALVDFTNPDAVRWYQDKLRHLVDQGVDCFKTDFGERVPLEIAYADGSDPERMHNWYTQLYNRAVFDVLEEARGVGEAVLFARSATVGGQALPVHWGGDSTSSYASMAETLRGGLSLAYSGFAFWSHDIGGFEGTPDAGVFKRWTQFGLLSSHSRLHGSQSYRVPWAFDEEAVTVTRRFTKLKLALMPYLYAAGVAATETGTPVLRPMAMEFPADPATAHLEQQYMLGADVLVAPVFSADGEVTFYLPSGTWTSYLTGEQVQGGGWRTERHGYESLPLYVRPGAVLPVGARDDRPDYDYVDGLCLQVYPDTGTAEKRVRVVRPDGSEADFVVRTSPDRIEAEGPTSSPWTLRISTDGAESSAEDGRAGVQRPV